MRSSSDDFAEIYGANSRAELQRRGGVLGHRPRRAAAPGEVPSHQPRDLRAGDRDNTCEGERQPRGQSLHETLVT